MRVNYSQELVKSLRFVNIRWFKCNILFNIRISDDQSIKFSIRNVQINETKNLY